jgi:hypothetical protein
METMCFYVKPKICREAARHHRKIRTAVAMPITKRQYGRLAALNS